MKTSSGRDDTVEGCARKKAGRPASSTPTLFIVRLRAGPRFCFGWELRRFGYVVLSRSEIGFSSELEA